MSTCSGEKRYLTGLDWVVNSLEEISRSAGGRGISSQIVLEFNDNIPPQRLRALLDLAAESLPVLGGHVTRSWNLCPYWKFDPDVRPSLPLIAGQTAGDDFSGVLDAFRNHVNAPFAHRAEHLRFLLLNRPRGGSFLGMHFDHRLLDAFGAEAFLELLARFGSGDGCGVLNEIELAEPPHLDKWIRRFVGGRNTNIMQRRLSRGELAALPLKITVNPRDTMFEVERFTPEQARMVKENAGSGPGFMLALPSMLAGSLTALHRLMQQRRYRGQNYVIPVSVVRRTGKDVWRKLFFNHVSFLFFQAPVELAGSPAAMARHLQAQLYEQMKSGLPEDIYHASMLTRIAPLPVMRAVSRIPLGGKVATGYFACLKESGFRSRKFLGAEVENLVHTPNVPVPPGLGIFLNFFRERLNLVVSYIDGLLADREAKELAQDIKESLLAGL